MGHFFDRRKMDPVGGVKTIEQFAHGRGKVDEEFRQAPRIPVEPIAWLPVDDAIGIAVRVFASHGNDEERAVAAEKDRPSIHAARALGEKAPTHLPPIPRRRDSERQGSSR